MLDLPIFDDVDLDGDLPGFHVPRTDWDRRYDVFGDRVDFSADGDEEMNVPRARKLVVPRVSMEPSPISTLTV